MRSRLWAVSVAIILAIIIPFEAKSASIWPDTTVPGIADSGPDSAVELGVKFRSDSSGSVSGIRFYKSSANSGTHIGNLWSSSGTLLATATFSNETASGWQQVNFATPVSISANTDYVASYHTNTGHYSFDPNYFTGKGVDSPPLHVPADGVSGVNGIYAYGAGSSYPGFGWNGSNYWVDVAFSATTSITNSDPILVISSAANPFSGYYAEILRAEGFNAFDVSDISSLSSALLSPYDVVILGEMSLTSAQVTTLSNWVNAGGHLIAMRPDKKLASLLGLSDLGSTIENAYLLVNSSSGPGVGIVDQTIQYHGTADLYNLSGASSLATLYYSSRTATSNPAVILRTVGALGGKAAAFTYDLARSVIYTRQGNPAWAGQTRDGYPPVRSDDLFYGNASFDPQSDWVDQGKVAIPQADEQQRLLANLIIQINLDKKPLPRFWYFPRNLEAVVVMTGDDHGNNGTAGRFDNYNARSPSGCSVANWECIRGTSYIYTSTPLTNAQASAYNSAGFEVGLHVNTNCLDWTPTTLRTYYSTQLSAWKQKYTSLPSPVTHRTHCIAWSDYATQPVVELSYGMRLDTTYYYWPPGWVANTPGLFTGSGMPMRYADSNGNLIDVYQAVTQMTDESGQTYPFTIDTLLDNAVGPAGFYGAFVANMHTDTAASAGSDAIINSARSRGVPVVSARQMLTWLDGRNASTFGSISWNGSSLSFSISAGQGANGLAAMVPLANNQSVSSITNNGSAVSFSTATIKGIRYVRFGAANGTYQIDFIQEPYTIWPSTTVPAVVDSGPDSAVELGVKFRSDTNGNISGIRFYKSSANSGTHIGNLWSVSGTLLATATFTNETASGWQQLNFATPVSISANTDYVASYHTNTGHYSFNPNFFTGKGVDSPPLHAPADGVSGVNGVYTYGSVSSYPSFGWNGSNYWVDVLFLP